MKWINHIAIAGATTALMAPPLVPVAILGSTAPDWSEWLVQASGTRIKHRAETHYVVLWLAALLFGLVIWDFNGIISAFAYGGLTHVFADSLTVTGVPFAPWSDRRFTLFGGRLKTGAPGEYFIAWGIVGFCALLAINLHVFTGWYPFFYNWPELYESGVIDGSEWKANRFKLI